MSSALWLRSKMSSKMDFIAASKTGPKKHVRVRLVCYFFHCELIYLGVGMDSLLQNRYVASATAIATGGDGGGGGGGLTQQLGTQEEDSKPGQVCTAKETLQDTV